MKSPAAFRATYSDWKLVKTRGVVQIVFEVPLADADAAYDVIGGMPNPSSERWFGIAPLVTEKEVRVVTPQLASPRSTEAKRDWRDLQPAQQAGIRCAEPIFWAFLNENYASGQSNRASDAESAAEAVRTVCNVHSRVELGTNQKARVIWHQLDEAFQAWKAIEHA